MEIKKENGNIITTQSFNELYGSEVIANEMLSFFDSSLSYPYQPERLNEKTSKEDAIV